jgi:hypothetical protein
VLVLVIPPDCELKSGQGHKFYVLYIYIYVHIRIYIYTHIYIHIYNHNKNQENEKKKDEYCCRAMANDTEM